MLDIRQTLIMVPPSSSMSLHEECYIIDMLVVGLHVIMVPHYSLMSHYEDTLKENMKIELVVLEVFCAYPIDSYLLHLSCFYCRVLHVFL